MVELRRKVRMVFQKSNPFPKLIFDNVACGLRINRLTTTKSELKDRVEEALADAALWPEVKTGCILLPQGFRTASSSVPALRALAARP